MQAGKQKFCQLVDIVGSENHIHKAVRLLDFFNHLIFLHHAAAKADEHAGIFLFQAVQIAQTAIYPLICIFADCTGIIEDQIGLLRICLYKARLQKNPLQLF